MRRVRCVSRGVISESEDVEVEDGDKVSGGPKELVDHGGSAADLNDSLELSISGVEAGLGEDAVGCVPPKLFTMRGSGVPVLGG